MKSKTKTDSVSSELLLPCSEFWGPTQKWRNEEEEAVWESVTKNNYVWKSYIETYEAVN